LDLRQELEPAGVQKKTPPALCRQACFVPSTCDSGSGIFRAPPWGGSPLFGLPLAVMLILPTQSERRLRAAEYGKGRPPVENK
jgi:hypothetical protein